MNLVLVAGLPASGKTIWARTAVANFLKLGIAAHVLDDPRTALDLATGLAQASARRIQVLFITDPMLCASGTVDSACRQLEAAGHTVISVFFANDPAACLRNARLRPAKQVELLIRDLAREYRIPAGALVLPVYASSLA